MQDYPPRQEKPDNAELLCRKALDMQHAETSRERKLGIVVSWSSASLSTRLELEDNVPAKQSAAV